MEITNSIHVGTHKNLLLKKRKRYNFVKIERSIKFKKMKSERFTQHNRGELEKCVRNRWKERKDRVRERDRDR